MLSLASTALSLGRPALSQGILLKTSLQKTGFSAWLTLELVQLLLMQRLFENDQHQLWSRA